MAFSDVLRERGFALVVGGPGGEPCDFREERGTFREDNLGGVITTVAVDESGRRWIASGSVNLSACGFRHWRDIAKWWHVFDAALVPLSFLRKERPPLREVPGLLLFFVLSVAMAFAGWLSMLLLHPRCVRAAWEERKP